MGRSFDLNWPQFEPGVSIFRVWLTRGTRNCIMGRGGTRTCIMIAGVSSSVSGGRGGPGAPGLTWGAGWDDGGTCRSPCSLDLPMPMPMPTYNPSTLKQKISWFSPPSPILLSGWHRYRGCTADRDDSPDEGAEHRQENVCAVSKLFGRSTLELSLESDWNRSCWSSLFASYRK